MLSNSILKKITIVIISYNRQRLLKKTIDYWLNFDVKLLILDGSDYMIHDSFLNNKNINYIHDTRGLYERLLSSVKFIETEFMILSCDDELYTPSALSSCINFLNHNHDYNCCGGMAIGFRKFDNDKKIYGKKQYSKFKNLSLDNDNPKNRVRKHFLNYLPAHLYSVIRSNIWAIIARNVFQKEFHFYAAWELQIEFLIIVSGKSRILPELMWFRNLETPPIRKTSSSMNNEYRISKWWDDKNFKIEKEEFLLLMEKFANEVQTDYKSRLSKKEIENLYYNYITNNTVSKNSSRSIFYFHFQKLQNLLKKIIFWNKIKLITRYEFHDLFKVLKVLETEGTNINWSDINFISSYLNKFK